MKVLAIFKYMASMNYIWCLCRTIRGNQIHLGRKIPEKSKWLKHGKKEQAIHLANELLLQLPNEPGVDFLEGLAQAVGDMDHHNLYVTGNINLTAKPQSPPTCQHSTRLAQSMSHKRRSGRGTKQEQRATYTALLM
jgi:hypothetical protein